MKDKFIITFEEGMPKGTAQQKGECIRYKIEGGKRVPYIHHFKKAKVSSMRETLEWKFKAHKPKKPIDRPVRLFIVLYFDIKERGRWGKFKDTRPDLDNWAKECIDDLVSVGFFQDDALIVNLHIKKYYAEKASIYIDWEELE